MASLSDITQAIATAVGSDSGLGKSLKIDLKGEGFILIDGDSVSNEDKSADLIMTISFEDFVAMSKGELNPMSAVMTGKLHLSDMMVAMGLQSKIDALMSRVKSA